MQRPLSYWRGVDLTTVQSAVLGLILVFDTLPDDVRRQVSGLCGEQVEWLRSALIRTRDVDLRMDLTPPPDPTFAKVEPRRGELPDSAPERDRVYAFYDSAYDFLRCFVGPSARAPYLLQAWGRAGQRLRNAILNRPPTWDPLSHPRPS
jgi:hypothetical protein